ncbi:fatty acyl-CoA reductase [Thraustotheca clavata]|uniref:Fatty acyl-CoA reductase n=1 Tax=Thraustotheca clavata TaxID=74557 RepID=A0A1V9Z8J0_9STRA|nr:fatty acyl-CoA reductase [Thraustotheca clavata]
MESFYAGKGLFLTGGTGFIGKTLIEKLLRCTPDIDKIYVLVRPKKGRSVVDRLESDVINSAIFNRLREERSDFDTFIRSKLHPIAGDINAPSLNMSPEDTALLIERVNIVVHSAASVSFNEPLDVAVEMNCLGAMYMMEFGKRIKNVISYVHVSTAYVNSNQRNCSLDEKLYPLDFDPEAAVNAVAKATSPHEIEKLHLNLIGTYPNTYTLTKSMAEHIIVKYREHLPLVIFRPTIVGAAWKEPVPGWVDQIAAAGAIFLAAGMGILTILPGNPRSVADIVPVDFVVNGILVSAFAKAKQPSWSPPLVVHSGTSDPRGNPLRWRVPIGTLRSYFEQNPPEKGLFPPKFTMHPSHQIFQLQWFFKYTLPSSVYSTVANATGNPYHVKQASRLWTLTWRARQLVELFKPFTENQWVFKADTLHKFDDMPEINPESWFVNAKDIVWERYLLNYAVGLKKWILMEDIVDVDIEGTQHTEMALNTDRILEWDPDHHAISFPGLLPDVSWAFTSSRKPGYTKSGIWGRFMGLTGWREGMHHEASHVPRVPADSLATVRNLILESPAVREAIINKVRANPKLTAREVDAEALSILNRMASNIDYSAARKAGWLLRKVWRHMYDKIVVDEAGLETIRNLVKVREGPLILIPTHRSYMDFLMMTYLFFAYNIPIPYVLAGEDFLNMGSISDLLRKGGAFFIRRSFKDDPLYTAIFTEYTQYLLMKGHTIEFFLEGTRSRSGKQLRPQFGMLSTIIKSFEVGRVKNIHIVPVTIDYDKPVELSVHQKEMLGEGKIKESLGALIKSAHVLRKDFGSISVQFGTPIHVKDFVEEYEKKQSVDPKTKEPISLVTDLAYTITESMVQKATCTPTHLVATILLLFRNGISREQLVGQTDWLRNQIVLRGGRVLSCQGRSRVAIVERALALLEDFIIWRRKDLVEPAITNRDQYQNMIGLGYYRNKILHWFNKEGVLAVAFQALSASGSVFKTKLIDAALFLHDMLSIEFVDKYYQDDRATLLATLKTMEQRGIFTLKGDVVKHVSTSQPIMTLLCAAIWPFIDSYWVAFTSLLVLKSGQRVLPNDLIRRMQWLAETMYHERIIAHYESCSLETLQNALAILQRWNIVDNVVEPAKVRGANPRSFVVLADHLCKGHELDELARRIASFRKVPLAGPKSMDISELLSEIPGLAKL